MKILITGATGFAGSHLVEYLIKHGGVVYGTYLVDKNLKELDFLKNRVNFLKLDLLDRKATENLIFKIKPDEIYHLAALTSPAKSFTDPKETLVNNILAEINLLEAVKDLGLKSKILIVGSADEYGIVAKENIPIDESTPLNPTNPYSVSKIAQDFLGLQYFNSYKLNIYRARPFNHIGPRQQERFVVPSLCQQIALIEKGKQEKIIKVGNLTTIRDFTDVRDIVKAYSLLLQKGKPGEVYNIGSGKGYEIKKVLNLLLSFTKVKIKIEVDPLLLRPVENPIIIADSSLFRKTTGWEPRIPLEKTLQDTLEYWREKVTKSS